MLVFKRNIWITDTVLDQEKIVKCIGETASMKLRTCAFVLDTEMYCSGVATIACGLANNLAKAVSKGAVCAGSTFNAEDDFLNIVRGGRACWEDYLSDPSARTYSDPTLRSILLEEHQRRRCSCDGLPVHKTLAQWLGLDSCVMPLSRLYLLALADAGESLACAVLENRPNGF